MQKTRDLSFDAFRGLAIIAVVAIHANYLVGSPYSLGFLSYRQLLNAAVPALFFMSGYWSSKKPIKSLVDYKTFLTRRLSRIFVPYLFWSFILLGYLFVRTGEINGYKIVCRRQKWHRLPIGKRYRSYICITLSSLDICANHHIAYRKALAWLGHSSSEMLELYYHLHDEDSQKAMMALANQRMVKGNFCGLSSLFEGNLRATEQLKIEKKC